MKPVTIILLAATSLITTACCSRPVVSEPVALPLPVQRSKPPVTADDVACLTDGAWQRIREREAGYRAELLECTQIIRSTHDAAR